MKKILFTKMKVQPFPTTENDTTSMGSISMFKVWLRQSLERVHNKCFFPSFVANTWTGLIPLNLENCVYLKLNKS